MLIETAFTVLVINVCTSPAARARVATKTGSSVFRVSTVSKLLNAIGSNRVILVEPGTYDLGSPGVMSSLPAGGSLRARRVHDGLELEIRGVKNLTIRAAKPTISGKIHGAWDSRPRILARPRYAFVLRFVSCSKITLDNLVLGHTMAGYCRGGVLAAERSSDIQVKASELFGSGTVGVDLKKVAGFAMDRSVIRDCTYGIANVEKSVKVRFFDTRLEGNRKFDLVELRKSPGVRFTRCTFKRNRTELGQGNAFFKLDKGSSLTLVSCSFSTNTFDIFTNRPHRLQVEGSKAFKKLISGWLRRPDPQYNQIYSVTRYRKWIVTGSQAGLAFFDPASGKVVKLVKAYITSDLVVRGKHLWASGYRRIMRFDSLRMKTYLPSKKTRGSLLMEGPKGELLIKQHKLVHEPDHFWRYDSLNDNFVPMSVAGPRLLPSGLGGALVWILSAVMVRKNGQIWIIDFMRSLMRYDRAKLFTFKTGGRVYPGKNPKSFYEDPYGRLWVMDFKHGFLRYDDVNEVFVRDPTVADKGSAMAVDRKRGRTWMLHYTDGVHLKEKKKPARFFNLSGLRYMRSLHLDPNGDLWVGGWNALVRIYKTRNGWRQQSFVVTSASLDATVKVP